MATQVQLRRGTATENNSFTGAQGELTFDTTNKRVRVHDGAAAGGFELVTEDASGNINTGTVTAGGLTVDTNTLHVDATNNRVGISTTSPSSYYANHLVVDTGSSVQSGITIVSDTGNSGMFAFADGTSGDQRYRGYLNYNHSNDSLGIGTAGSEAMRLGSDGTVLVGKTASDSDVVGVEVAQDGHVYVTVNNTLPLYINRQSGDELLRFASNGSTVGKIGVTDSGDRIYLAGGGAEGVGIDNGANAFVPTSETGAYKDSHMTLGRSDARFTDLHLSGSIEIQNGTGNTGVGKTALNSNTGANNTALGFEAGYSNSTGVENTYLGRNAGYYVTSGNKNTIVGAFHGNQGGLDIRTSSNNIVLSDGDGNPRIRVDSNGKTFFASSIFLGGSTSSANELDDYEEGTWTPAVSNMTVTGTLTTAGRYTKVGRMVSLMGWISATTSIAHGVSALISGFPFAGATVTGENQSRSAGVIVAGVNADLPSSNHSAACFVDSPNSRAFLGNFTTTAANEYIYINVVYYTA